MTPDQLRDAAIAAAKEMQFARAGDLSISPRSAEFYPALLCGILTNPDANVPQQVDEGGRLLASLRLDPQLGTHMRLDADALTVLILACHRIARLALPEALPTARAGCADAPPSPPTEVADDTAGCVSPGDVFSASSAPDSDRLVALELPPSLPRAGVDEDAPRGEPTAPPVLTIADPSAVSAPVVVFCEHVDDHGKCVACTNVTTSECSGCVEEVIDSRLTVCDRDGCENAYCAACKDANMTGATCNDCVEKDDDDEEEEDGDEVGMSSHVGEENSGSDGEDDNDDEEDDEDNDQSDGDVSWGTFVAIGAFLALIASMFWKEIKAFLDIH